MDVKKILKSLANIDVIMASVSLTVLIIITFAGVIARYAFKSPFGWMEEMQVLCFLYTIFFGGSYAVRVSGHIGIDILVDSFHGKIREIFEIIITVIVTFTLVYCFVKGCNLVEQLFNTNRMSNMLQIPYALFYMCEPIWCILMILNMCAVTWNDHVLVLLGKKEAIKGVRDIDEDLKMGGAK